jgi:hypothetical protein
MLLNDIIEAEQPNAPAYRSEPIPEQGTAALDQLFGGRTTILKTKLEVFATEIFDRLTIRSHNLLKISEDEERVSTMLDRLAVQANYHLREHKEKAMFYELRFELERQKRGEDVECWRDVAQVMKDFLNVWEALEQAKSRSMFLNA